jgi:hypothetical protein
MVVVYGLTGMKRSGKDTVAEMIENDILNESIIRVKSLAFADELKRICSIVTCIDIEYFYDDELKDMVIEDVGYSPREIMQGIGTGLFRDGISEVLPKLGKSIWVNNVKWNMLKHINDYDVFIIKDIRFPNELEMLRNLPDEFDVNIIRITRPSLVKSDTHESESHFDNFDVDYDIINDGTIDDLYEKIHDML